MCYLRFWTCLLLWAFRVEWASGQSGNNSERLQSPPRLFVGLTWKNYEKLRWYGLQIVRDQISYCNHHAIWHNVTQNVAYVNGMYMNVYSSLLFTFSPAIAAFCILHPVFGCWSNPQMRKSNGVALIVLQLFLRNLRCRSIQSVHVPRGGV